MSEYDIGFGSGLVIGILVGSVAAIIGWNTKDMIIALGKWLDKP